MKTLLCGAALLASLAAPAAAEMRYDRNLEKAVMNIVARKIGGLRGGFTYKQAPQFVVVQDRMSTGSLPTEVPRDQAAGKNDHGLKPGLEQQASRVVF